VRDPDGNGNADREIAKVAGCDIHGFLPQVRYF